MAIKKKPAKGKKVTKPAKKSKVKGKATPEPKKSPKDDIKKKKVAPKKGKTKKALPKKNKQVRSFARWNSIMQWLYRENHRLGSPHTRSELWRWGKIINNVFKLPPLSIPSNRIIDEDILDTNVPEILAENNIEFYPNPLQIDQDLRESIEYFHIWTIFEHRNFPNGIDVKINGLNESVSEFNSSEYKYDDHLKHILREFNRLDKDRKVSGVYLFYGFVRLKPGENPMLKKSYYLEYFLKEGADWVQDIPSDLHYQAKLYGDISSKFMPTPDDIQERKQREPEPPEPEPSEPKQPTPPPAETATQQEIEKINKQIELEREKKATIQEKMKFIEKLESLGFTPAEIKEELKKL